MDEAWHYYSKRYSNPKSEIIGIHHNISYFFYILFLFEICLWNDLVEAEAATNFIINREKIRAD